MRCCGAVNMAMGREVAVRGMVDEPMMPPPFVPACVARIMAVVLILFRGHFDALGAGRSFVLRVKARAHSAMLARDRAEDRQALVISIGRLDLLAIVNAARRGF